MASSTTPITIPPTPPRDAPVIKFCSSLCWGDASDQQGPDEYEAIDMPEIIEWMRMRKLEQLLRDIETGDRTRYNPTVQYRFQRTVGGGFGFLVVAELADGSFTKIPINCESFGFER